MGLFGGSTKQSSASSASGVGTFAPKNNITINAPFLDLSKPYELAAIALICTAGFLAWKRFK